MDNIRSGIMLLIVVLGIFSLALIIFIIKQKNEEKREELQEEKEKIKKEKWIKIKKEQERMRNLITKIAAENNYSEEQFNVALRLFEIYVFSKNFYLYDWISEVEKILDERIKKDGTLLPIILEQVITLHQETSKTNDAKLIFSLAKFAKKYNLYQKPA